MGVIVFLQSCSKKILQGHTAPDILGPASDRFITRRAVLVERVI